jgi:hypothetical protein
MPTKIENLTMHLAAYAEGFFAQTVTLLRGTHIELLAGEIYLQRVCCRAFRRKKHVIQHNFSCFLIIDSALAEFADILALWFAPKMHVFLSCKNN